MKLAVILPGVDYHFDKPLMLMYFSKKLSAEADIRYGKHHYDA